MDDAARIRRLEAELRQARDEVDLLRKRESALVGEVEHRNHQLAETLEQQTATAEVLHVIASSPTDLQGVLDAVAERAVRVCDADDAQIFRSIDETVYLVAHDGPLEAPAHFRAGRPLNRTYLAGRTVIDRMPIHLDDYGAVITTEFPEYHQSNLQAGRGIPGHWSILSVPLIHEGVALGSITVRRVEVRPFTERQIALLQTFADQAAIAIENARLFGELQEANRQLAEASRHKSQVLANMSHELRTPLNAIIGYSEMLQEEAEDLGEETLIPDLQKVNAAGKHLLGLINDILDLSKIEAGRMDLDLTTFEVGHLVQDVEAIVQPLVEKNGNALVVDCPGDLGAMRADQTKLRQALFNLLSNAAKFTEGGTITLRVAKGERSGGTVPRNEGRQDGEDEEDGAEERGRLGLGPDRVDAWKPAPTPGSTVGAGFQQTTPATDHPNLPPPGLSIDATDNPNPPPSLHDPANATDRPTPLTPVGSENPTPETHNHLVTFAVKTPASG